jgi:hypothetical protein
MSRTQFSQKSIQQDAIVGPVLIESIPFSSFVVSSTLNKSYLYKLNRNAKRRTFIFANYMDQQITNASITLFDSTNTGNKGGDAITKSMGVNWVSTFNGETNPQLMGQVDSISLSLPMGATAPLSGNLIFYVVEVL